VRSKPESKRSSKTDFCRRLLLQRRSLQSILRLVVLIRKLTVPSSLAFHALWLTTYSVRMLQIILMSSLDNKCLKVCVVNPRQIAHNWHFQGGLVRILIRTNFYHSVCAPSIIPDVETKVKLSWMPQVWIWIRTWLSILAMSASLPWELNVVSPHSTPKVWKQRLVLTFTLLNMTIKMSILKLSM
jgi:hypothetical protein